MATRVMQIIKNPDLTRYRVQTAPKAPVVTGEGGDPYICGACEVVLIDHLTPGYAFERVLIKCPACGEYNLAPDPRPPDITR